MDTGGLVYGLGDIELEFINQQIISGIWNVIFIINIYANIAAYM
jgi:hypothetical protein